MVPSEVCGWVRTEDGTAVLCCGDDDNVTEADKTHIRSPKVFLSCEYELQCTRLPVTDHRKNSRQRGACGSLFTRGSVKATVHRVGIASEKRTHEQ